MHDHEHTTTDSDKFTLLPRWTEQNCCALLSWAIETKSHSLFLPLCFPHSDDWFFCHWFYTFSHSHSLSFVTVSCDKLLLLLLLLLGADSFFFSHCPLLWCIPIVHSSVMRRMSCPCTVLCALPPFLSLNWISLLQNLVKFVCLDAAFHCQKWKSVWSSSRYLYVNCTLHMFSFVREFSTIFARALLGLVGRFKWTGASSSFNRYRCVVLNV